MSRHNQNHKMDGAVCIACRNEEQIDKERKAHSKLLAVARVINAKEEDTHSREIREETSTAKSTAPTTRRFSTGTSRTGNEPAAISRH